MDKEKAEKALEMLRKSGVTVAGDLVLEKHVDKEIGNVEKGGIGIMINGKEMDWKDVQKKVITYASEPSEPTVKGHKEEVFKFIHPAVDSEEEEWKVEVTVKRENLEKTIFAVKQMHPYEEPVINAIPLYAVGI